eukprot:CAMPEP_0194339434 /NCGR_PEP_ID=MMETSP0171-20130528/83110_1 /TAXON_ID=218684 /ORGANISM="Corethron pennatum, Strain L29A3" /LENGTH=129 /DNA_ID=CAMNT_0039103983 /DNA_START=76 /DNA_END=461 /DNA_ORIENTATION=+
MSGNGTTRSKSRGRATPDGPSDGAPSRRQGDALGKKKNGERPKKKNPNTRPHQQQHPQQKQQQQQRKQKKQQKQKPPPPRPAARVTLGDIFGGLPPAPVPSVLRRRAEHPASPPHHPKSGCDSRKVIPA